MAITKIRGGSQIRLDSIDSSAIKDRTLTGDDIALGSLSGDLFINGSLSADKINVSELAGDGLAYNPGTNRLDADLDLSLLQSFNGPSELVKLGVDGKLPVLDGSNLVNVAALPIVFIDQEVPVGAVDGTNAVFTLSQSPSAGSLHLWLNGILQRGGASNDYALSGNQVTMASAPSLGSSLVASYRA